MPLCPPGIGWGPIQRFSGSKSRNRTRYGVVRRDFSTDITKLKGPVKWSSYYLYVILDIFSRYVVGWLVANQESTALARTLIRESCTNQHVEPDQLTLHADRGSAMKAKALALFLACAAKFLARVSGSRLCTGRPPAARKRARYSRIFSRGFLASRVIAQS